MVWDALEIIDALIPVKSAKCKGLLLPGVGGHSVHGHEGPEGNVHRSIVVGRIGLRSGGGERIVRKISGLGSTWVAKIG